MDLYEALKAGTKEEELKATFEKELATARMKIAAEQQQEEAAKKKREQQKQKEDQIRISREFLIDSILDYAETLFGESSIGENANKTLEQELIKFEKEIMNTFDLFDSLFNNKKIDIKHDKSDDEIIQKFLDSLK